MAKVKNITKTKAKKRVKIKRVRTEPVSLNESTLETNIASEIATMFNSAFGFWYPNRLSLIFELPKLNLNYFRGRKTKLYRLTPTEENLGGGWDTKITIPVKRNESRAIFIQFKSGKHSDGNTITGSQFNESIQKPNPHIEFKFNDNSDKDQHEALKKLSDELVKRGISDKSVLYAFPRITDLKQFEELEDPLLFITTFLTITKMDSEAVKANANLYDGKVHKFRTCYVDENKREIASEAFKLTGENEFENILYEIMLVKFSYFRNHYVDTFSTNSLNDEIYLTLGEYLKVNPTEPLNRERFPEVVISRLNEFYNRLEKERDNNFRKIYGENNLADNTFDWRVRLLKNVHKFFNENDNSVISIKNEIPANFTFNLPESEPIEFTIPSLSNTNFLIF